MSNIAQIKSRKKGVYFNYAGFGRINKQVYSVLQRFLEEYLTLSPSKVIVHYRKYINKLSEEVALLLNCEPEEISYIKNTTEGIIIASEILPLPRGSEVLILENEYAANFIPWLKKKRDGIKLKIITGPTSEQAFNKLLSSISDSTRAIAISLVQYYDGYMCDLELLSKVCKRRKIFLVVDGIQAVGTRKVDLRKTPVDILVCGGHKHLNSMVGTGFIYVNKKLIKHLKDFKVGVRSVQIFNKNGYRLKNSAGRFEDGTPNLFGIVALHASIKSINTTGLGLIERKNLALLSKLKDELRRKKVPFIDYSRQGNLVALKVNDPEKLRNFLQRKNIDTKTIKNIVRISFHYKSRIKDFVYLVDNVKEWLTSATP